MKIKVKQAPFEKVMQLKRPKRKKVKKPNILLTTIVRILAAAELKRVKFTYTEIDMDKVGNKPCLILMNHSSFIDLKIVSKIFYPKKYNIVCTSDGFVGKEWLMRLLGCIPTNKFITDIRLALYMKDAFKKGCSVLMYPEASYTFDGCNGVLPSRLGVLIKKLGVPVVTIITKGAFSYDPLYNCLQKRHNVPVSAQVKCLLTTEQTEQLSTEQIDNMLNEEFTFDNFRWQQQNKIKIVDEFRADGLNRILYKCPHCKAEGYTRGQGENLTCNNCGKIYHLDEYGYITAFDRDSAFVHIPDWYNYQRRQVREEILQGKYKLDIQVDICMMVNYKAIYKVGEGRLTHDVNGFVLDGCEGELHYEQSPLSCYSLYSDYYWYEIGDVICIGNKDALYYCFPKNCGDVVAKTRLAVEELYKLKKSKQI